MLWTLPCSQTAKVPRSQFATIAAGPPNLGALCAAAPSADAASKRHLTGAPVRDTKIGVDCGNPIRSDPAVAVCGEYYRERDGSRQVAADDTTNDCRSGPAMLIYIKCPQPCPGDDFAIALPNHCTARRGKRTPALFDAICQPAASRCIQPEAQAATLPPTQPPDC